MHDTSIAKRKQKLSLNFICNTFFRKDNRYSQTTNTTLYYLLHDSGVLFCHFILSRTYKLGRI